MLCPARVDIADSDGIPGASYKIGWIGDKPHDQDDRNVGCICVLERAYRTAAVHVRAG